MKRLAYLMLVLSGVFWGVGFPLGKVALAETNPGNLVFLRFAVAAVIALPFALRRPSSRALFRSPVVVGAGVLYGLAFVVQFEGLARASVTLAALMVGAMPALIAICARLLGEPVSRTSWVGVAAATAGAALIAGRPGEGTTGLGVALSLVALLVFLAWIMVLRRAPRTAGPMATPAVTVIVAALTILPVSTAMYGPPQLDLSPVAWAAIVGQGLLSTLLATAAWGYGAERVDAASAGVFINIEPLMGAAIGVTLFGDKLSLALGLGGLLILGGSLIVVRGEGAQPA